MSVRPYYISDLDNVEALFQKYVGVSFKYFYTKDVRWIMAATSLMIEGKPRIFIDIFELDLYLRKQYKFNDEMPMSDFIKEKFGQECHDLIESLC